MPAIPVIVVHGGAGEYEALRHDGLTKESYEAGVQEAARVGWYRLQKGGSAVDAVQAAVMSMEKDPTFNSGRGSCLTRSGTIEQDGSMMDGRTLACGGVIGLSTFLHPIAVARDVMDKSEHVLFAGAGAAQFALDHGHQQCSMDDLTTEKARKRLERWENAQGASKANNAFGKSTSSPACANPHSLAYSHPGEHDTVGAVAVDKEGNVAYAMSTGGVTGKEPGRVGDSPLVGCGGYADNAVGAVCMTGTGEAFIRIAAAKHMTGLMEAGESAQSAVEITLAYMHERVGGTGGAIGVSWDGGVGVAFTAQGMAWASVHARKDDELQYGIYPGECKTKTIQKSN